MRGIKQNRDIISFGFLRVQSGRPGGCHLPQGKSRETTKVSAVNKPREDGAQDQSGEFRSGQHPGCILKIELECTDVSVQMGVVSEGEKSGWLM